MDKQNFNGMAALLAQYKYTEFDKNSAPLFRQAVSNTSLAICLSDPNLPDSPLVLVNDAFCQLTGYTAAEIIGRNCRFLQGPATTDESLRELREALTCKNLTVTEIINYRKDGTAFVNALHMAPLFDVNGKMVLFYGSQMDTTETVTVDLTRRRRALSLTGIGLWEYNPATEESFIDEAMRSLLGLSPLDKEITFENFFDFVHPEDRELLNEATWASISNPDVSYDEDFRVVLQNDEVRWLRSKGGMAKASDGSGDLTFIGVTQDVTDEKQYEAALTQANETNLVIAGELDHRIKNIYSTVSALVTSGARGEPDAIKAASKTRERIMAMSRAHDMTIGKGVHGKGSLKDLVETTLAPYVDTASIDISGTDLQLSQSILASLGLILHELSTNAAKYGALNNQAGRLSVSWSLTTDDMCTLIWEEQGGKKTEDPVSSSGFGTKLINLSASKLSGAFLSDLVDGNLKASFQFPT